MVRSMFTPAFSHLIRAVVDMRKRAGLTQRQLAEALNREQNYVARIETGQRRVDLVELIQICRACGANPTKVVTSLVQELESLMPVNGNKAVVQSKRLKNH